MSTPEIQQVPEALPRLSEPERIINTFVAPTKTFTDIRHNASWFVPFLIIALFSLGFIFAIDKKIGWEQIMQNEIAKNPQAQERLEKMPPEQREQGLQIQLKITKTIAYANPVIVLVIYLVVAAVLMATFNFGFGTQVNFSKSMAIVTYGSLPSILSALLGTVTLFAGVDPEGINIRNPVATNPAYLMNPMEHKFLYGVASAFDIVTLWVILLMAIGFSTNTKVKRGAAFAAIFGWYFLLKLAGAAISAIS